MSDFDNIKAGDNLACSYGYDSYQLVTVDRVTPTQIVVDNQRFNRRTGRRVGETSGYFMVHLLPITDGIREKIEADRVKGLRRSLTSFQLWEKLADADVCRIYAEVKALLDAGKYEVK